MMKVKRVLASLSIVIFSGLTLASDQSTNLTATDESEYSKLKSPPLPFVAHPEFKPNSVLFDKNKANFLSAPPLPFAAHPEFKLNPYIVDKEKDKDKAETETDNAPFPSFDEQERIFSMEEDILPSKDSKEKFISSPDWEEEMKKLKEAKALEKKETTDSLPSSFSSQDLKDSNSSGLRESQPIPIDKPSMNKIIDMDESISPDKIETIASKPPVSSPKEGANIPANPLRLSDESFKRNLWGATQIVPSAMPVKGKADMTVSYFEK